MKKVLLASLAVAATCSLSYGQAQRRVLIEGFSNASCGPCAAQNPGYNNLIYNVQGNLDKVVSLKYQVNWPGTDPMNAQYPTGPSTRRTYYGVTGVPDMYVDGNAHSSISPGQVTQTMINNRYATTSPIEVHLNYVWNSATSLDVTVKIKNVSASAFGSADHRLHVAVVEKHIQYATPPGSNGETNFYGVVRSMHPDAAGASFASIPAGDSLTVNYTIAVPAYIYSLGQVAVAAFVQNNTDKSVANAQFAQGAPLPSNVTDAAASSNSSTPANYCTSGITPSFTLTNNSASPLVNVRAYYTINGGAQVTQDLTGLNLSNGQSQTVTFPAITFAQQSVSNIVYGITNINQGQGTVDASTVDNTVPAVRYVRLSDAAVASDIEEGFETMAVGSLMVANAIVIREPANQTGYGVAAVGSNGSGKSFKFDFFNIQNGSATIQYDKMDISGLLNPELEFDYAYARYSASFFDRMQVLASGDCGATWTTLFDRENTVLATAPDVTSAFSPTTAQWQNVVLPLTAFAGSTELLVAFKGLSGYGNNLFVDNININGDPVSVQEIALNSALEVFPNPTSNELNVRFDLPELTDLNVVVYNAMGQQVLTVANGAFQGANNLTFSVRDLAAGMYHLNLVSKQGVMTQRFVVTK